MESNTNKKEVQPENYEHKLYHHCQEKDAEAVAWAFVNEEKYVQFPYKNVDLEADEIRANVLYAGLCLSDSMTCRGRWGKAKYPLAPGHEIIAEVSKVGSGVKDFKVGDKVAFGTLRKVCENCKYCKRGNESLCEGEPFKFTYGYHWGGYSTQIQHPASFFFHLPEGLDLKRAAPLLCAGITVYTPIKKYVQPGDKCAVIGIGGLGHLAVMFLAKMGYNVTAITSSANKKDFILGLGASDILVMTDDKAMAESEGQFDFIISTIPAVTKFHECFNLLASGGTYVVVGSGDHVNDIPVNVTKLVVGESKLVGSLVGNRADTNEMLKLCVEKDIYPITELYDFNDFPTAYDKLENGRPIFRCVVNMGDFAKQKGMFK